MRIYFSRILSGLALVACGLWLSGDVLAQAGGGGGAGGAGAGGIGGGAVGGSGLGGSGAGGTGASGSGAGATAGSSANAAGGTISGAGSTANGAASNHSGTTGNLNPNPATPLGSPDSTGGRLRPAPGVQPDSGRLDSGRLGSGSAAGTANRAGGNVPLGNPSSRVGGAGDGSLNEEVPGTNLGRNSLPTDQRGAAGVNVGGTRAHGLDAGGLSTQKVPGGVTGAATSLDAQRIASPATGGRRLNSMPARLTGPFPQTHDELGRQLPSAATAASSGTSGSLMRDQSGRLLTDPLGGNQAAARTVVDSTFQDWYARYRSWDARQGEQYWSRFGAEAQSRRDAFERQALTWATQARDLQTRGIDPDYRLASPGRPATATRDNTDLYPERR